MYTAFLQGCTDITTVAKGCSNVTPYVLISGEDQGFLVVDKVIISDVKSLYDIPFVLMAAYFVFNICYPKGCSNLFSHLEIITLKYPPNKASPTVKHFLSSLKTAKYYVLFFIMYTS